MIIHNINNIWETYILLNDHKVRFEVLRTKIAPLIKNLKSKHILGWYCFLVHQSRQNDDNKLYYHLRLEFLIENQTKESISKFLPDYCLKELTEKFINVEKPGGDISGINKALIKNNNILKAWEIIGEQSELVLKMLNIHKDNISIQENQISQFLHFLSNMTQLAIN